MQRRTFITHASSAVAGVGVTTWGCARAGENRRPTFVFVHGAWHGAWCWAEVVRRLGAKGFAAIALDMPGHGLTARFPAAYASQDPAALATEVSPLAALSTTQYRDSVIEVVKGLVAAGSGPVILVGHSLGGATLTTVAEAEPRLIRRLVYVSAFAPVKRPAPVDYTSLPSFSASQLGQLLAGDPRVVACMRINFSTADTQRAAAIKNAFYADLSDAQFSAVAKLLTPDEPIGAFATPINPTVGKWGRVPRTFIRCTLDRAIPIDGQDQMIAEADQFTAVNKFVQETLETSHSPFLSAPEALVSRLVKAARD